MSGRESGGAQEIIQKPVPKRKPLIQCSRKRGRHPLNKGHSRVHDGKVAQGEALTQGPVYTLSPLSAAVQGLQDTQSHQGWEPAWSRLSLEALLVLLLKPPNPSRDAEQGSDTTCPHIMVLPSTLPVPKEPIVPDTAWCYTQSQLHRPPAVTRGVPKLLEHKQLPLPLFCTVLTVLAVHSIVPCRALANVVGEDVAPVWDQLALTIVVARIGVAGPWGRGKTTVMNRHRWKTRASSGLPLPTDIALLPSASRHHTHTWISALSISHEKG